MGRLYSPLLENPSHADASPQGTAYFLGLWPKKQDQSLSYAQKPYDGPDARYVQLELIRSSIVSGYEAFDYTDPYKMPWNFIDPEPKTPAEIYYIGQTSQDVGANVAFFSDVLGF